MHMLAVVGKFLEEIHVEQIWYNIHVDVHECFLEDKNIMFQLINLTSVTYTVNNSGVLVIL